MVLAMVVLLAAWVALALPAAAQTTTAPAAGPTVAATETAVVTGLPSTGHGIPEPSDAGALALRHAAMTVLVLLAAAAAALGGVAVLGRYERR
jgi:hypothetical protein